MTERDLVTIYGRAGRSLREVLLSFDLAEFDEGKAAAIKAKAERIIARLNADAARWIRSAVGRAYKAGAARTKTALEILGKRPVNKIITGDKAMKDAVLMVLVKANGSIRRTVEQFLTAAVLGAQAARFAPVQAFALPESEDFFARMGQEAVRTEKSRGWLQKQIYDHLKGLIGDDDFIEINGRHYNVRKYSKMVARTSLRQAQTEATLDLCRKYNNDLVRWSDHATDCAVCDVYEGNVYSISGTHPTYPKLEAKPPIHPNCKHSLLPTSDVAREVRKEFSGAGAAAATVAAVAKQAVRSAYVKAKTKAEAEQWARDNIARYVSYQGASLEVANLINKNLFWLKEQGIMLDGISSYASIARHARLHLRARRGGIFAVVREGYWGSSEFKTYFTFFPANAGTAERLKNSINALIKSGFDKAPLDMDQLVVHEIGHIVAQHNPHLENMVWENWQRVRAENELARQKVNDLVGSYIFTSKGEFFAECFRLYRFNILPDILSFAGEVIKNGGF